VFLSVFPIPHTNLTALTRLVKKPYLCVSVLQTMLISALVYYSILKMEATRSTKCLLNFSEPHCLVSIILKQFADI
jgi:hypothetical protein